MRCISCKISFKPTAFNQKSCRLNGKTHDEVLEAIEERTAEIRKSIKLIK